MATETLMTVLLLASIFCFIAGVSSERRGRAMSFLGGSLALGLAIVIVRVFAGGAR